MNPLYPTILKRLRKQLNSFGYRLSIKPSTSLKNDFTGTVEKIMPDGTNKKIFSTRGRKELLQGVYLICKIEMINGSEAD